MGFQGLVQQAKEMAESLPFMGRKLPMAVSNTRQEGAMKALAIVTMLGTLNFMHQIVGSAVKVLFQEEMGLSDGQAAYPVTALSSSALVFAVILGWINDKNLIDRRTLMFFCIFIWSFATTFAGFSKNLGELVFW